MENELYLVNNLGDYGLFNRNRFSEREFSTFLIEQIHKLCQHIWDSVSQCEDLQNEGIYSGNVGISYMFWYLSKQTFLTSADRDICLFRARTLISRSLNAMVAKPVEKSHSFFTGTSGICLIAGLIFNDNNDEKFRDHYLDLLVRFAPHYLAIDETDKSRDTLLDGRAGYVCGSLWINRMLGKELLPVQTLLNIGISIIKSGKFNALETKSELPVLYQCSHNLNINAIHGMSGTLLSLLCLPDLIRLNPLFETDIKTAVDYILSGQSSDGSYFSSPQTDSVNWGFGSSGVCWLMAKAYLQWSDRKYKYSIVRCGELIWKKGLSRKPGIGEGIVGNGYTFLMLYRITSDPKYIFRAKQFAKYLFDGTYASQCKDSANPYSLYDGLAGVVCYLADILCPESAQLPLFFDIFHKESAELSEDLASFSDSINDNPYKAVGELETYLNS